MRINYRQKKTLMNKKSLTRHPLLTCIEKTWKRLFKLLKVIKFRRILIETLYWESGSSKRRYQRPKKRSMILLLVLKLQRPNLSLLQGLAKLYKHEQSLLRKISIQTFNLNRLIIVRKALVQSSSQFLIYNPNNKYMDQMERRLNDGRRSNILTPCWF